MMTIALHGAYFSENFGDELLLSIQSNWIKEIGDVEVILPLGIDLYKKELNLRNDLQPIEALKKADLLVYGGGGYFGEPNFDRLKWNLRFFKYKHHYPAKVFRDLNKPYIIVGTGAGPVSLFLTRNEIRKICNNAKKIAVRDSESANFLIMNNVNPNILETTVDVVLSISANDIPKSQELKAQEIIGDKSKKIVGIHFGTSINDKNYSNQIKEIADYIIDFFNKNISYKAILIADKRNSIEQNEMIDYISSRLVNEFIIYKHSNVWLTTAIINQLDKVITTKLHVGIVAYSLGVEPFSIAAHQKTKRFYKQINLDSNCIELEKIDFKNINNSLLLIDKFLTTKSKYENMSHEDKNLREALRKKALYNKKIIQEFIINHH